MAIFRQYGFFHCGAQVLEGTKYTVRTDIMYKKVINNDLLNVLDKNIVCGMCNSTLFYKQCLVNKDKVPSCKCPHIYGQFFDRIPCISCKKSSTFDEIIGKES